MISFGFAAKIRQSQVNFGSQHYILRIKLGNIAQIGDPYCLILSRISISLLALRSNWEAAELGSNWEANTYLWRFR